MPVLKAIDHIHVHVTDRAAATAWYARVFGLEPQPELAVWAEGGGPLTLGNAAGTVHLALFERPRQPCRSTVAFAVGGEEFAAWRAHLEHELGLAPEFEDHRLSWSLYFYDPDGNPFEITTYEVDRAAAHNAR